MNTAHMVAETINSSNYFNGGKSSKYKLPVEFQKALNAFTERFSPVISYKNIIFL